MNNVSALLVMATDSKDEGRYPDLVGILSERHYLTKVHFSPRRISKQEHTLVRNHPLCASWAHRCSASCLMRAWFGIRTA
jgi:hypothetical protein